MAQLTVRNLDPELVRQLKIRAAVHNRSAEAEHRAILETALDHLLGDSGSKRLRCDAPLMAARQRIPQCSSGMIATAIPETRDHGDRGRLCCLKG